MFSHSPPMPPRTVRSDAEGWFRITGLPAGSYRLRFRGSSLSNPQLGWAYVDQAQFAPQLHGLQPQLAHSQLARALNTTGRATVCVHVLHAGVSGA